MAFLRAMKFKVRSSEFGAYDSDLGNAA